MASSNDDPDVGKYFTGLFIKWFIVAIVFEIWLLKKLWPFLKFTGIWAPFLILWLDISLKKLGVPGDIWGMPFVLSCVFCVFWTGRNLISKKRKPPEAQGALPSAEVRAPRASGVFFGTTPPEVSFWGKPKGEPSPVTKPITDDGHVLVVGGAGSGKSSCIAIPTLRDTWRAAALVVDIKGELYTKSGRRKAYVFNPLKQDAKGYDPFYLLKGSLDPSPDIREIALTLCPKPPDIRDTYWIESAQSILTGHLLYCYKHNKSFIQAIDILQSTPIEVLFDLEMQDTQVRKYLMNYVHTDERTLGTIMSEISNKVVAFATDPHIQATLSKKDIITPQLLEQGYDIFLQLPEHKLEQWRSMIALIVQQFARHFEQRPDYEAAPILFMLDEFPRLGKMETVVNGLATLRSKRITIMPIIQSLAQLDKTYGHDTRKVICDNCSYTAILRATDADTQRHFSQLVGTEEREKRTYNREGMDRSPITTSNMKSVMGLLSFTFAEETKSTSITTEEKPIIKPEDFAYLQDIVLLTPYRFMRVQKVPYYQNQPQQQSAVVPMSPIPQPAASIQPGTVTLAQSASQQLQSAYSSNGTGHAQKAVPESGAYRKYDLALEKACYPGIPGVPKQTMCASFYLALPQEEREHFRQYWEGQERESSGEPQKVKVCQMILQAAESAERSQQYVVRPHTFAQQKAYQEPTAAPTPPAFTGVSSALLDKSVPATPSTPLPQAVGFVPRDPLQDVHPLPATEPQLPPPASLTQEDDELFELRTPSDQPVTKQPQQQEEEEEEPLSMLDDIRQAYSIPAPYKGKSAKGSYYNAFTSV